MMNSSFKVEKYRKKLQMDFIGTKNIISYMNFFLLYMHYKLNFEAHWSDIVLC